MFSSLPEDAVRGSIGRLVGVGVFGPETVRILASAFNDAWARLQASNAPIAGADYASEARTILAESIIALAKAGETDPRNLADGALLRLAKQKLSRIASE
jgi:hypothetical protein